MQTLVDTTIHTTISVGDLPWEDIAACRAVPNAADLFFSEDIGDIAAAKRGAPTVRCWPSASKALDRRELFGVWGGQLFINGKMLTVKRRRVDPEGRPSGGPDAGRADSGASAGHRPEAVRLSPSQTRWRGRPRTPPPHDPPPPAPASPTARVTSIEPGRAGTGGGPGNEDGGTRHPMPGVAISSFSPCRGHSRPDALAHGDAR